MNSILSVTCFKKPTNEPEQINEVRYDEIDHEEWIYRFQPLPGSLFSYEMDSIGTSETLELLFDGPENMHEAVQSIIKDGLFAHSESDWMYVIHLLVDEQFGTDEWTNEPWVTIDLRGVMNPNSLKALKLNQYADQGE